MYDLVLDKSWTKMMPSGLKHAVVGTQRESKVVICVNKCSPSECDKVRLCKHECSVVWCWQAHLCKCHHRGNNKEDRRSFGYGRGGRRKAHSRIEVDVPCLGVPRGASNVPKLKAVDTKLVWQLKQPVWTVVGTRQRSTREEGGGAVDMMA